MSFVKFYQKIVSYDEPFYKICASHCYWIFHEKAFRNDQVLENKYVELPNYALTRLLKLTHFQLSNDGILRNLVHKSFSSQNHYQEGNYSQV